MPVFPEASLYYKGRTNTQLVVSEGNAPAEKYLASEATNGDVKFNYEFGPEDNNGVVIPKGKILSFAGVEYDIETEQKVPRVKIADGTAETPEILAGVNHHNVYQRRRDRFSGSDVTLLTREYIRVPLFSGATAAEAIASAAAIKFGAMSTAKADENALLGKYVTADKNGNFVVAASPSVGNIVGQVYGIDTNIPPAGFLQYFLEFNDAQYDQFIKATGNVPSPGRTADNAGSLDVGTFPLGAGYLKTTKDVVAALKNFRAGIPFLTDGYFKARTSATYGLSDAIVKVAGDVVVDDATGDTITVSDPQGAALFIRLPDTLCKDTLSTSGLPEYGGVNPKEIKVTLTPTVGDPGDVSAANIHVDYDNNMVVVYFTGTVAAGTTVSVVADVLQDQVPGIPTGWDFKNTIGEARILLMK